MNKDKLKDAVVKAALRWASVSDADRDLAEDALMVAVAAYQPHAHTETQEVVTLAAVKEAFEGAKAQNETLRGVLSSQTPATVTLALWRSMNGEVMLDIAGSNGDVSYNETWRRLGTVTLPLDREDGR